MVNLKRLRGKLGLTQKELADRIGVTKALIVYLENPNTRSTGPTTVQKLCEIFNVSPCELFGIDNLRYMPQSKEELANFINILQEQYEQWDS